jgi:hypothetical protein
MTDLFAAATEKEKVSVFRLEEQCQQQFIDL